MSEALVNAPQAGNSTSPDLKWYVVHAYSGMEKAVERNIICLLYTSDAADD